MVIIYLPFLCCQPSSAITTIVINEGSIYQPASTRFLFLASVSPPPLLHHGSLLFLHLFSPPSIHPSTLPSIHHSHSGTSKLSLCLPGKAEMLPVTPELQTPIQAAGGGPAAVNQSVACVAEGMGVDTWKGLPTV